MQPEESSDGESDDTSTGVDHIDEDDSSDSDYLVQLAHDSSSSSDEEFVDEFENHNDVVMVEAQEEIDIEDAAMPNEEQLDDVEFVDEEFVDDAHVDEEVVDEELLHEAQHDADEEAEDEVDEEWLAFLNGEGAPPEVHLPDTPPTDGHDRAPFRTTQEILNGLRRNIKYSDNDSDDVVRNEQPLLFDRETFREIFGKDAEQLLSNVGDGIGDAEEDVVRTEQPIPPVQPDEEDAERLRLRKLKGKGIAGEDAGQTIHKSIRFTQGTVVENIVDEHEDPNVYPLTQGDDLLLDGEGNIHPAQPNVEFQFAAEQDNFDDDLEAAVREERVRVEHFEGSVEHTVQRQFDVPLRPCVQQRPQRTPGRSKRIPIEKEGCPDVGSKKKRKTPGTYARFVHPYKHLQPPPTNDEDMH